MQIEKTPIKDLLIITPDFFDDERGFFFESFNEKKYGEILPGVKFAQDNISRSKHGVVRGLHYQIGEFAQGKLCSVLEGRVLDVAVDIRSGSPTYGMHYSLELSDKNHKQFWLPPGFAHGFSVLSEHALFMYKCTALYSRDHERAIIYNDTDLDIDWMVGDPSLSEKDLQAPTFKEIEKDFNYE